MKRHGYGRSFLSCVLIGVVMLALQPARAQFGLDKLKKGAEKAKETLNKTGVTKECEPLKKLQDRLKMIRTSLDGKDATTTKIHLSQANMFKADAEKTCPGPELTAAGTELASYEKEFGAMQSGAETTAQNQGDDEETLRQSKFKMDGLQTYYNTSWTYDMNGPKATAQKLYDFCKSLDYPALKKNVDAIMARNPEFNTPNRTPKIYYDNIATAYAEFGKFVDEGLTSRVNNCIEEAYKFKAQGKSSLSKAQNQAEAAVLGCQAALLMIPGHAGMEKLLKQAEATVKKIGGESGALYTSEFHKQNAGKIVFSKTPIEAKQENPSAMLTSFLGGDHVYGMIYCSKTWNEATRGDYNVHIRIQVDGVDKADHRFKMVRDKWEATHLTMEFIPDPATMETEGAIKYSKALAELSPRPHKVKVICEHESYDPVIAEGEFDFDLSETSDKMEEHYKEMVAAKAAKVRMPASARKDAKMEKEMMAAVTEWPGTPLRAVITDADWQTHRNPISGAIEFRSMHGAVAFKLPEGTCKMFYLDFRQMYNGSSYGKTDDYAVGDSEEIPCENVMK